MYHLPLLLLYIPHCSHAAFIFLFVVNGADNIHAYHLTSAIIMIFKICLTVPVTQSFIIQR